jgi:hypothetical protein
MNKVTLWYKVLKDRMEFNHLEDGWNETEKPQPKHESFTNQKAWAKEDWHKKWTNMAEDGYVYK